MSSVLFASVPVHGHVTPLLPLAGALAERGDRVRFLTGARFRSAVSATGAEHVPLPAEADFDDRDISARFPEREGLSPVRAVAHDIEHVFVRPGAAQYAAVRRLLDAEPAEVVVTDPAFAAGALLLQLPSSERPPIVVGGVIPLNLPAPGLAPFGFGLPPRSGLFGRVRNGVLKAMTAKLFAPVEQAGAEVFRQVHGEDPRVPILDWTRRAEALVQFTVPSFEYPRPDTDARLVFAGPVSASSTREHPRPEWWDELGGSRPVVHVTQGTLANDDLGELILPTIEAFADEDVLVVVATGGAPVGSLGRLPSNVRAAEFVPYEELLPRTAVMVSNGGYGGVHFALRHGVPVVVAPGKEDKVEVAARVAWSGVGIRLRTQRPAPGSIRTAVERVLREPSYRDAAGKIRDEIAHAGGTAAFVRTVDDVRA